MGARNNHIKTDALHDWQPRACTKTGCDPTILFATRARYRKRMEEHAAFTLTMYRVPDFDPSTDFQRSKIYNHFTSFLDENKSSVQTATCRICSSKMPGSGLYDEGSYVQGSCSHASPHLRETHGLDKGQREAVPFVKEVLRK